MRKALLCLTMLFCSCWPLLAFDFKVGDIDLQIHGFVSQGFLKSNHNNYLANSSDGSWQFNEAGLNFQSQLTERLRFGVQFFSRDLGTEGNNQIVLDWAYGDYKIIDPLSLQFGKIKAAWGFYNQGRDVDLLRLGVFLPAATYSEDMRTFIGSYQGGAVHGTLDFKKLGEMEYHAQFGTTSVDEDAPVIRTIFSRLGLGATTDRTAEMKYFWSGTLRWQTPLPGLRLGGTYGRSTLKYSGRIPAMEVKFKHVYHHNFIFGAEYTHNNLTLASEFTQANSDFLITTLNKKGQSDPQGYYFMGSYRFFEKLEIGSSYSVYYRDRKDKAGRSYVAQKQPDYLAWQKDWSISARYDVSSWLLMKLEYHRIDGVGLLHEFDNPTYTRRWNFFAAKATVSF